LLGAETATANPSATESRVPANQAATTLVIPDDLRPLVQQQLEAAATQRLAWHGEIWPQQTMEWEIERDAPQGGKAADDATVWQTNLRLRLPRLGAIDARLQLNDQGVQLVLRTPNAGTATDLQSAVPSLQQAFDAAGLTLLGVQTKHDSG
jgi:flagellar hook-length control protein FliK